MPPGLRVRRLGPASRSHAASPSADVGPRDAPRAEAGGCRGPGGRSRSVERRAGSRAPLRPAASAGGGAGSAQGPAAAREWVSGGVTTGPTSTMHPPTGTGSSGRRRRPVRTPSRGTTPSAPGPRVRLCVSIADEGAAVRRRLRPAPRPRAIQRPAPPRPYPLRPVPLLRPEPSGVRKSGRGGPRRRTGEGRGSATRRRLTLQSSIGVCGYYYCIAC